MSTSDITGDKTLRDDNPSVWNSPFGGFHIGEEITHPQEAIEEYLAAEIADDNTREHVKELVRIVTGDYVQLATESGTADYSETPSYYLAYEDTSVGGCDVMNPLYQFCENDDIVPPINHVDSSGNGMGRVYSDMYRENMHVLWMSFGVPRYNNLGRFYRQAYNRKLIDVMTSGDTTLSAKVGTIIGRGVGLALSLPILPFIGMAKLYDEATGALFGNNVHKYYELKPAMHTYYKIVNTILAQLAVHMNIIPNGPSAEELDADYQKLVEKYQGNTDDPKFVKAQKEYKAARETQAEFPQFTKPEMEILKHMGIGDSKMRMPLVISAGPDIVKILSSRHKRRRDNREKLQAELGEIAEDSAELHEIAKEEIKKFEADNPEFVDPNWDESDGQYKEPENTKTSFEDSVTKIASKTEELAKEGIEEIREAFSEISDRVSAAWDRVIKSEVVDEVIGKASGEMAFIGFRIEKGSDQSESISNSSQESDVGQKLKSMAQGAKNRSFNFAGGNLGLGPIDTVISAVDSMIGSLSSMVGIGGLSDMITKGSGYLDIPKVWGDSNFSKSYSFDLKLQSSYADELSIYQSIYIPLALLMAAAFPRGIGKNSYTSPFLVQAYSKGMFSVPLGMISSMSIRRGQSENGWTHNHLPTVVDVSITIEDLSPMMFLSMTDKSLLEAFRANTAMQDYYATLAGVSLQDRSNARKQMLKKWRISKLIWAKNTFNMGMLIHKIGSGSALRRGYSLRGKNLRTGV